jgi:hypothetical protein
VQSLLKIELVLILLTSSLFMGCTGEDEYLPNLSGNMVGYTYTFDEFGNLLDDHGQVKVTAIGLDQSYSRHSDAAGRFELEGLPTGTYELHFEKEGFGVLKQFGVQHLGGNPTILPSVSSYDRAYFLYEMPSSTITSMTLVDDSLSVDFSFSVPDPPSTVSIRIYFSASEDFTLATADYVEGATLWNAGGHYTHQLYFQQAPFEPGERVYFKACRYTEVGAFQPPMQYYRTVYGTGTYYDFERNETIYPNLGDESAQYSFIFPE